MGGVIKIGANRRQLLLQILDLIFQIVGEIYLVLLINQKDY